MALTDAANGEFSLSLLKTATDLPEQDPSDFAAGRAYLVVRPGLIDPDGHLKTIGLQLLYVL